MFERVLKEPFNAVGVTFADGFTKYTDGSGSFHEAGFDAYCTGVVFARLARFADASCTTDFGASAALAPLRNRIHLFRHYGTIMDLAAEQQHPVFFASGLAAGTAAADLHVQLAAVARTVFFWNDDTSCFIAVLEWADGKSGKDDVQAALADRHPEIAVCDAQERLDKMAAQKAERAANATPASTPAVTPAAKTAPEGSDATPSTKRVRVE